MPTLNVNGQDREFDAESDTPLLWILREQLGLTGTKFGCGVSDCGACTVLIDDAPERSCMTKLSGLGGAKIVTIEGLAEGSTLHKVQKVWIDEQVAQCGYCQSAQILVAASLLKSTPQPSDAEIDEAMSTVLCRCGTYPEIRAAFRKAATPA